MNVRRTTEYSTWVGMWHRCNATSGKTFRLYGSRGICVCKRWEKFENFLEDMGRKPLRSFSLDRIDNDGIYEPGNCRWADDRTQSENRRCTRWFEHGGLRLTLAGWARRLEIAPSLLSNRLQNWPPALVLSSPISPHRQRINPIGLEHLTADWKAHLSRAAEFADASIAELRLRNVKP